MMFCSPLMLQKKSSFNYKGIHYDLCVWRSKIIKLWCCYMDLQGEHCTSFRTFKLLENDYHVYAIDLLGKGSSSRPDFLSKNCEEAEEFFIQSIEKWRKTVNITNFHLIGHSMGGYISAKYALRYSEHINKLILWSPLGVEPRPEKINKYFISKMTKIKCCKTLVYKICELYAKSHSNYHNFFKCFGGCFSKWITKRSLRKIFGPLNDEELKIAAKFYYQIAMTKDSGESAITYFMDVFIIPIYPILNDMDKYKSLGIDVTFVYGDNDWLDTDFSGKKISEQLKEKGYKVDVVSNSEHNIYTKD